MFNHYLITRYNVPERTWTGRDKHGGKTLTEEWLIHRWVLFQKYCLPSVKAQTCSNFRWIILIDKDTPKHWKEKLEGLPIFTVTHQWLLELQTYISLNRDADYIITTRLDNDDALAPWVMAHVQGKFQPRFHFIDFPQGYRLKDGVLYYHAERANSFMSLVEESNKTVMFTPHGKAVLKKYEVVKASLTPSWMQVIHERNYKTEKVKGGGARPVGWVRTYYGGS